MGEEQKPLSDKGRENWDSIFGKNPPLKELLKEKAKEGK